MGQLNDFYIIQSKLSNEPGIKLANEDIWQKLKKVKKDGRIEKQLICSEIFARLTQVKIAKGEKFEEAANAALEEVKEGLNPTFDTKTGAVMILSRCWEYGQQLHDWYFSTQTIKTAPC